MNPTETEDQIRQLQAEVAWLRAIVEATPTGQRMIHTAKQREQSKAAREVAALDDVSLAAKLADMVDTPQFTQVVTVLDHDRLVEVLALIPDETKRERAFSGLMPNQISVPDLVRLRWVVCPQFVRVVPLARGGLPPRMIECWDEATRAKLKTLGWSTTNEGVSLQAIGSDGMCCPADSWDALVAACPKVMTYEGREAFGVKTLDAKASMRALEDEWRRIPYLRRRKLPLRKAK